MNRIFPVFMLLLIFTACEKQEPPPADRPPSNAAAPATSVAPNLDLQPTHATPTYTVAIEESATEPPTYSVVWTARVDTSGWKITTESVLVEEDLGKSVARVFTIVHEPQPGDTVTTTPETLTARYDAGTKLVEKAELNAKHTVRDSKPTYPQLYSVVQRAGN